MKVVINKTQTKGMYPQNLNVILQGSKFESSTRRLKKRYPFGYLFFSCKDTKDSKKQLNRFDLILRNKKIQFECGLIYTGKHLKGGLFQDLFQVTNPTRKNCSGA